MKKQFFFWAVCLLAGFRTASAQDLPESCPDECTSIAVGRLATTDGSVFTSHTCDGVSHSWVSIEKAADHPRGAMTPIYKGTRKNFFRGDTTGVKIVGEVPQVAHTYAYLNTGYPSLNEKQVAIGETTFSGPDTLRNYGSLFVVEELCRLALERCDNARDAVILMGSLGEKYGYADGGECLTVADKNEVWFFEILGCGRGKKGAVWAAQRVPDGEVAVSANIPRIGRLRRGDPDFLCSDNVESVARTYNLWDGEGEFIFWKAFNAAYGNGRYFREREWFIFNTLAPSLQLSFDAPELPFSVKPDTLVDVRTLNAILRSTYEGTFLDMTQNWKMTIPAKNGKPEQTLTSPLANPWLTTDMRNTLNTIAPGTIEFRRTVAVCWCSYSTVIQLRSWLPDAVGGICWLAYDNPGQSPRFPIFAGGTSLPSAFDFCGHKKYVPDCALWLFRRANRLATVAWQTDKKIMMPKVLELEDEALNAVSALEPDATPAELDALTARLFRHAADEWKVLEETFWAKHGRGF